MNSGETTHYAEVLATLKPASKRLHYPDQIVTLKSQSLQTLVKGWHWWQTLS